MSLVLRPSVAQPCARVRHVWLLCVVSPYSHPEKGFLSFPTLRHHLSTTHTLALPPQAPLTTTTPLPAPHPGITDTIWYLKADDDAYLFSWIISRVRSVLPWLGVGQPTGAGAISSIYVSNSGGLPS